MVNKMNTLKASTAAALVVLATVGAASAIDIAKGMPSNYLDEVHAKLIGMGYYGVRVIDADSHRLTAQDKDGSEVVLVVHPSDRTITFSSYVHPLDY
jgi:hypothetical protein